MLEHYFVAMKVSMLLTEKEEGEDDKENNRKGKVKKIEVMKERPAVIARDVEDLVAKIIVLRNLNPANTEVQIGIDDGQGQLKAGLQNIFFVRYRNFFTSDLSNETRMSFFLMRQKNALFAF